MCWPVARGGIGRWARCSGWSPGTDGETQNASHVSRIHKKIPCCHCKHPLSGSCRTNHCPTSFLAVHVSSPRLPQHSRAQGMKTHEPFFSLLSAHLQPTPSTADCFFSVCFPHTQPIRRLVLIACLHCQCPQLDSSTTSLTEFVPPFPRERTSPIEPLKRFSTGLGTEFRAALEDKLCSDEH